MAFILSFASGAGPDVFVGYGVGVFGCYGYFAVGESFGAFVSPNGACEKWRLWIEGIYEEVKSVRAV